MGGVILFPAPRYCERAIKLGVTKMDTRIKELIKRIERLEKALREQSADADFVHQMECVVAGYEARVEYLLGHRRVEHFLG